MTRTKQYTISPVHARSARPTLSDSASHHGSVVIGAPPTPDVGSTHFGYVLKIDPAQSVSHTHTSVSASIACRSMRSSPPNGCTQTVTSSTSTSIADVRCTCICPSSVPNTAMPAMNTLRPAVVISHHHVVSRNIE